MYIFTGLANVCLICLAGHSNSDRTVQESGINWRLTPVLAGVRVAFELIQRRSCKTIQAASIHILEKAGHQLAIHSATS